MKMHKQVWIVLGSLVLSGAALAQVSGEVKGGMGQMGGDDAKITKEQFLKRAEAHFARMDANQDGTLDATDRAQMQKRMQECVSLMGGMGMMGSGMGMMGGGMGGMGGMGMPGSDGQDGKGQ